MRAIRITDITKNKLFIFSILLGFLLAGCSASGAPTSSLSSLAPDSTQVTRTPTSACLVTEPVLVTPPDDPAVLNAPVPGYYFVNEDRSIWASAGRSPDGKEYPLQVGEDGNKVGWFRPAGATLEISGQRLDGQSPPLRAEVPCCYPTQFQATGLIFPTAGCWEVTAKAEGSVLTFVVKIEAPALILVSPAAP